MDITAFGPVVALAAWTHVMALWMLFTRVPAIVASKMRVDRNAPRGQQMSALPASVRWKADNYNHLMEQPTVFYAVAIVLAWIDPGVLNLTLAWIYVALRVVHSVWQATVNHIPTRFALFLASFAILLAMTVRAIFAVAGA